MNHERHRWNKILVAMSALVAVGACSMGSEQAEDNTQSLLNDRLVEAIERSSSANRAIAETEVATAAPDRPGPGANVPPNVTLPPEAVQPVTVDWQGPIDELLEDMAERAGYSFSVDGNPPTNMMMVNLRAEEEPLFGVVRRAGNQVHGYADIAFNPSARSIEIRYGR